MGFIFFTRCSSPRGYANKEPRHLWRVGALNTQSQKNTRTRGSLARKQEKQWSAAMIMHQICLHHISSLRWRKNTQLLICPSASSFSLPLPLTHSQTLAFIPAFTSLFFFSTSLSRSQKICKHNKTFFFSLSLFLKWIPAVKEKHKHAGPTWKLPPQKHTRRTGGRVVGDGGPGGWTQHFKHLRNLMQSGATALQ